MYRICSKRRPKRISHGTNAPLSQHVTSHIKFLAILEAVEMKDVDFAALVRLIRRSRGQTQEELARELDVTVGTMNGWENGRHRPVRAQRRRLLALAEGMSLAIPEVNRISKARERGQYGQERDDPLKG